MYCKPLSQVDRQTDDVGLKAAYLGEMIKAGINVPEGFVIVGEAFQKFLKINQIEQNIQTMALNMNTNDRKDLKEASEKIQKIITDAYIPETIKNDIKIYYDLLSYGKDILDAGYAAIELIKGGSANQAFVSVRPSPIEKKDDFAKSLLNVYSLHKVMDALKKVWASFYSEENIKIRKDNPIPQVGIIVQKMVKAEKSGVLMTANPLGGGGVFLEASWGLGASIASGIVVPDYYVLDNETGEVLIEKISKKVWEIKRDLALDRTIKAMIPEEKMTGPAVTREEIKKLYEISRALINLFRNNLYLEWGFERGKPYILEAGIEGLELNRPIFQNEMNYEILLEGTASSPGVTKGKVKVVRDAADLETVSENAIIVSDLNTFELLDKKPAGLILDNNAVSSRISRMARGFNIPCIVGTDKGTSILAEGQEVILDGTAGKVYELKDIKKEEAQDITATEIYLCLLFPKTFKEQADYVDGCFLRAEHMHTESGLYPFQVALENPAKVVGLIVRELGNIARMFYPKPVIYRSLDLRSDLFGTQTESNPILGWRGLRRSLEQQEVFRCELKAISELRMRQITNISLALPFLSSVEEVRKAKDIIFSISRDIPFGIMVQTPSSALNIDSLCQEEIGFVVIDLDELSELSLGYDRENSKVSNIYRPLESSVGKLVKNSIDICSSYGIKTMAIGDLLNNPNVAEDVIELGFNSLLVEPEYIKEIKSLVLRTEKRLLLDKLRKSS